MEQKIKNFDRTIEQMMNETSVTPPYGMWNRISAQLDAEMPAVAPSSVAPNRIWFGMAAGVMLLGATFIAAYFINSNNKQPQAIEQEKTPITNAVIVEESAQPLVEIVEEIQPVVVPVKKVTLTAKVAAAEKTEERFPVATENKINIREVAIPEQLSMQSTASDEPYYFPPVDIDDIQEKNTVAASSETVAKTIEDDDEPKLFERKNNAPYSKKVKFKKKKAKDWNFGRINHNK